MATRFLSLLGFLNGDSVSNRKDLFSKELDWLKPATGNPGEALFIHYAYNGGDFAAYFNDLKTIFRDKGINLIDIDSGKADSLITNAKMYVVAGGDLARLITKLNSLKTNSFDPYKVIKSNVDGGVGYMAWNESTVFISPVAYDFPGNSLQAALKASPYQFVYNYYNDDNTSANPIRQFLIANKPSVLSVVAQVNTIKEDKTSVRLEETGSGIIYRASDPHPVVTRYFLDANGNLSYE
jgi:hypothetical protein